MEAQALSMVGRLVLAKSVAQSIPAYTIHAFLLPQWTTKWMDGMVRSSLRGHRNQQARHLCLKYWETVYKPKYMGGLGLRKFYEMNQALIAKLAWHIYTTLNKICVQLIKSRYMRGRKTLDIQSNVIPAS